MPTGTKIAAIVLVVLLGAAGLYFAFVAPSTPHAKDDHKESGTNSLNDSSNPSTLPPSGANANGLGTGTTPGATNPTGTATGMSNLEQLARNNANAGAGVGTTTGGVNTGATTGTGSTVFPPSTTPTTPNTTIGNGATAPAGSTAWSGGANGRNGYPASGSTSSGSGLSGNQLAAGSSTGAPGTTLGASNGGASTGNTTGNKSTPATGSSSETSGKTTVAKGNTDSAKTTGEHTHVVTKGETFASIAKSELGSAGKWEMIAKANPNVNEKALKIGTKLRIPSAASGTLAAGEAKIERGSGSTTPPSKALASNASTTGTTSHVVASGETMSSIAKAIYGNSKFWKAIAKANPSVDPDAMKAGQKLNIPSKTTVVGDENVEPASSR
jgi:nucleoid-associated protein YgaU